MALTLEIVTPEGKAYSESIEHAVLPGVEGEVDILPGHIPLLIAVSPGQINVKVNGQRESLVIDKGYARVLDDNISVLTEAAIDVNEIDLSQVEQAELNAKKALNEAEQYKDIDPAEIEKLEAITRFSLAQKVAKQRKL